MRLIVYSHDAYGLGNIRRMLAICNYLLESLPELSLLLVSGSPLLHSFRLPPGLDYIKLPCLGRNEAGEVSAKYLHQEAQQLATMRAEIIKTAVANFEPDLILVDKKPYGLQEELKPALDYVEQNLPATQLVLLLRDILDAPEVTIADWHKNDYYNALQKHYDRVLVVGMPEIFDTAREYQFPAPLAQKTTFCGYIRREYGSESPSTIRQRLQVQPDEKLVLVTLGGGGDGYHLVETYLQGLTQRCDRHKIKSLIISGPEMPLARQQELAETVRQFPGVQLSEFTDDIASYMDAADTVVCMGGYNTICEVLSLSKKAVVIPRTKPVQEQWIRAQKMDEFGLLKALHPDRLTPENLLDAVIAQLETGSQSLPAVARLDLQALPRISKALFDLVHRDFCIKLDPEIAGTKAAKAAMLEAVR